MIFTLNELDDVVRDLMRAATDSNVWLFYGEMGAGKTTVIKAVCRAMGVRSPITSPTFSIVNEYSGEGGRVFYHFDFYRLKNEEEAYDIGVEEYLDSGRLCFVEWPERISSILPPSRFEIHIDIESPTQRRIRYQKV